MTSVQNNPLSVLWGPPGTGKTFTLACMLRMFLRHDEGGGTEPVTALVVAFQHKALEELRTRLEMLCTDFTIAIKDVKNEQKCYIFTHGSCLLYTSDAADEEDSVDLGGRRIIKKKKKKKNN
eukprot:TRINITY_DN53445_c0_g1_i1.p1 TRINITY_DN53445_c0_g1~~TRINITY_DN53445_c0_g1_i1.p1  ORF type:complete len:122 (-),score=41.99 TRINITY_DN53445_c0_g1_i1:108-473(-)